MIRLVLRRLAVTLPLLWLVATLTFVVAHAVPGSLADLIDNPRLSPQGREVIRERYGLDLPLHQQYARWLESLARGDLGVSFLYRQPVAGVVARALPPTLLLTGTALVLDLLLGVAIALFSVVRPHSWFDRLTTVLGLTLYGLPTFWVAGLAILLFSVWLGWLPASHMHSVDVLSMGPGERFADLLRHLVLPATALGIVGAAGTARYLRSTLLDIRSSRFLLAARARGLSRSRVLCLHALRPALLPLITILGLSLPFLVSGALVIEVIFSWPGMGRVMWTAAWARDVPVILATTLLAAGAVIAGNLLADILYIAVDPRTRRRR